VDLRSTRWRTVEGHQYEHSGRNLRRRNACKSRSWVASFDSGWLKYPRCTVDDKWSNQHLMKEILTAGRQTTTKSPNTFLGSRPSISLLQVALRVEWTWITGTAKRWDSLAKLYFVVSSKARKPRLPIRRFDGATLYFTLSRVKGGLVTSYEEGCPNSTGLVASSKVSLKAAETFFLGLLATTFWRVRRDKTMSKNEGNERRTSNSLSCATTPTK